MPVGIVQFFIKEKGYGYIRVPESREEFYVRQKHLQDHIEKGDRVRFDLREDRQGMYAVNVRLIEKRKEQ